MAYTFPLSIAQFMDLLPVQEMTFDIPEAVEMSETGAGEILMADLGTRLWQGQITLGDMTPDEAADAISMIDLLRGAGASFFCHDTGRPGPRLDLDGSILGAAQPVLNAVNANAREIRLSGLPAGYQLRRYDSIAFTYGANPLRYARHRIVRGDDADGTGLTGWLEVVPPIRPGWTLGSPVELIQPACKAVIVPKSVQPGRRRHTMTVGTGFKWVQTLR